MSMDDVLLVTEGLSKSFGDFRAVSDVFPFAFGVGPDPSALIGPNGAGKASACFNMLSEISSPHNGRSGSAFNGRDITNLRPGGCPARRRACPLSSRFRRYFLT